MRRFLIALALLFTIFGGGTAVAETRWQNFGVNKAYTNRDAAVADAPRTLKRLGWPPEVIKLAKEAMKQPGKQVYIVKGDRLDSMCSGANCQELWRDVLVDFKKPPIKERMEYTTRAEEWQVEWGGKVWVFGIPEVCNNFYTKVLKGPPPPPIYREPCAYDVVTVRPGDEAIPYGLMGRFRPSGCFAVVYAGAENTSIADLSALDWQPLPNECPMGPCDFSKVVNATGMELVQSGGIKVKPGRYVFRVSREFAASSSNRLVLCLQRFNGWHSCGIGVQNFDYLGEHKIATVYYTEAEIPPGTGSHLWWPDPDLGFCPEE